MAFNQQLLMHNMTVKGKRLTSGMERFVQAVEKGEDVTGFAYHYALGCLGGDFIAKKLMKTKWLPEVVDELVSKNLMKREKGEKLKAEWKEKFVPTDDVSSHVSSLSSQPTSEVLSPTSSPTSDTNADFQIVETADSKDEQTVEPTVQTPPQDVVVPISRISFVYDNKTKVCDYKDSVPKTMLGLFYDICDSRSVTGYFPKTIEHRGAEWVRCPDVATNDANKTIVVYQISR